MPKLQSFSLLAFGALLVTEPARGEPAARDVPAPLAGATVAGGDRLRVAAVWGGYGFRGGGPTLALDAGAQRAAAGGGGNAVRVWDLASGRQVRVVADARDATALAFSPDGRFLAIGSEDGGTRIWDLDRGRVHRALRRHRGEVTAVAFTPDGALVVTGGEDGAVRSWDLASGKLRWTLTQHAGRVRALALGDKRLASAGEDGTTHVCDVARARCRSLGRPGSGELTAIALSPGAARLALVEEQRRIRVVEAESGAASHEPIELGGRVLAVRFGADGSLSAVGSDRAATAAPGTAFPVEAARLWFRRWDPAGAERAAPVSAEDGGEVAAVLSADARRVLVSDGRALRLLDAETAAVLRAGAGHAGQVEALAWSPAEGLVVSVARDGTARGWDAATGAERWQVRGFAQDVKAVAFSADGAGLLVADVKGAQRLLEPTTGAVVRPLGAHRGVQTVGFGSDGSTTLSASYERIAAWDAATGADLKSIWFSRLVSAVDFSADGTLALVGGAGEAALRDTATGKPTRSLKRAGRFVTAVALARDGTRFALATVPEGGAPGRPAIEIWEAARGRLLRSLPGRASLIAWSPDGASLLAAAEDGSVRLFDPSTGRSLGLLGFGPNAETVTAAAFAPDGRSLALGTSTGAIVQALLARD